MENSAEPYASPQISLRWARLLGTILCVYALVGGLLSFAGWALDIRRLTDWSGKGISIQPNAAIAVIVASASLLLLAAGFRRTAGLMGTFVWLIGASSVFQIVSGLDLGVNTLLTFGHEWGQGGVISPGRMGTPGAVSWTLIGIAIILISISVFGRNEASGRSKRARSAAAALAMFTLAISTLSIIGYLYGAESLYALPRLTTIAFQTATFIFAVSVAILTFVPDAGPMTLLLEDSAAGSMARHAAPVIILIPVLLGGLRLIGQQAGLYDLAFGTAVRTLAEIVLLLVLLWLTARSISRQARSTAGQTAALQESEERRKLAQDAGDVGIFDWMIPEGRTYWSETMWSFYGEDRRDVNPDESFWSRHIHDSDRERVKANIRNVVATSADEFRDEFKIVRKDGSIRWIEAVAKVTRDQSGTATRMYGVNLDITHRKMIEEQLRASENQIRLVTDTIPALVSYVDPDLRYRFVNQKYTDWFGVDGGEIIGKTVADIAGEEAFSAVKANIEKVLAGQELTFEAELDFKNVGIRYVRVSYVPDFGFDANVNGFYAMVSDLSDLKRAQDELQQAHDDLELRVKDRTTELAAANNALIEEMQEREIAERQRIDLLRRLVTSQESERRRIARDLHDQMGQRLTALRLKVASLSEISIDHEQFVTRVGRLQEIAERLDAEVSFMAWELRPSTLDDLGLFAAVEAFVNEWSRHYEIPAEFHSSGLSKERLSHEAETHLYRISQEALNNIAKHADAKNVTVLLERRGETVSLIVEDDGKGFDPDGKTISGGSTKGLGLVGMSERATLVGGEVEIESAPGQGTTIYVRVPFSL